MPLAQLADPWQKMPMGGTPGEVRSRTTPIPEPPTPDHSPTFCRVLRVKMREVHHRLVMGPLKVSIRTHPNPD